VKCPECGEIFPQDNKFCPGCGKKVSDFTYDTVNQSKNKKPIPTWQIIFILFCVVVGGFYVIYNYNNSSSVHSVQKPKRPDNYKIINEKSFLNIKTSLDIRLKEKVDKNTLREIANELYNNRKHFERVFIVYYLPGMEVDKGGWATSHFNPNLEIKIIGTTKEGHKKISQKDNEVEGEKILGSWIDEQIHGLEGRIIIYRKKGHLFMRKVFKDGSIGNYECIEYQVENQKRIKKKNDKFGDYFVIDSNKDLWYGDAEEGLWAKCKRIR